MTSFGERLKKIRKDKGLSQSELAEMLNSDTTTIGRYERNQRTPDAEFLDKLYSAIPFDANWLLFGKRIEPAPSLSPLAKMTKEEQDRLYHLAVSIQRELNNRPHNVKEEEVRWLQDYYERGGEMPYELKEGFEFHQRFKTILKETKIRELSKKTFIPMGRLAAYRDGKEEPVSYRLQMIAEAVGVSYEWLKTGKGPMRSVDDAPSSYLRVNSPVDENLMAQVADRLSSLYKEVGARLSPGDLGRLSARIVNDVISVTALDDGLGRESALRMALLQVRRELLEHAEGRTDDNPNRQISG